MNLFNKDELIHITAFTYRIVVASCPLIEFALERTEPNTPLYEFFVKHFHDEYGHDSMAKADLISLGVVDIPLIHAAAQFAGSQYYLIAHMHPAILLGYMKALESESIPIALIEDIEHAHNVELTFLRHHAIHDPEHSKELDEIIATLPAELQKLIDWNMQCVKLSLLLIS